MPGTNAPAPPAVAPTRFGGGKKNGEDGTIRALFVRHGSFSLINDALISALSRTMPEIAFETIDLADILRGRRLFLWRGAAAAIAEYGFDTALSRGRLRYRMHRSLWFNRVVRKEITRAASGGRHRFVLQTQSLFDASLPGRPHLIYTDHVAVARDWSSWRDELGRPRPQWLAMEGETYRRAARVFTFGSRIRDLLVEAYGVEPSHAIRVGAGPNTPPGALPFPERHAARRILFVGVEWERKGGPDLVRAFRKVRRRLPDATLTIVGCRPEVDEPGVEVLGRLSPAETQKQFARASCYCMPSLLEPFGIVFVEALHAALPIVASDVGDLRDLVREGENGHLVRAGDSDMLADRLTAVLSDPARVRRMGETSAALAEDFTWDRVAGRIAGHVRALV